MCYLKQENNAVVEVCVFIRWGRETNNGKFLRRKSMFSSYVKAKILLKKDLFVLLAHATCWLVKKKEMIQFGVRHYTYMRNELKWRRDSLQYIRRLQIFCRYSGR